MKTLIAMLLISIGVSAQEVQVFDQLGNLINEKPIEKKDVPDLLDHLPSGQYLLVELVATKKDGGMYVFKRCLYNKESKNIEVI